MSARTASEESRLARIADATSSVVRRVGRWLRYEREQLKENDIDKKQHGDFVSRADKIADEMLREGLLNILPGSGVISEEEKPLIGQGKWRWIVDPLDGTTNYLAGLPHWAISVALEDREQVYEGWGDITIAVIYVPDLDKMYISRIGAGVSLNGSPISISNKKLTRSTISHWWPKDSGKDLANCLSLVKRLHPKVAAIRNIGSPAVELAMVAEGTLEGFWAADMEPWDLAAGILLVEEAGGLITDPDSENPLDSGWPIAGNRETAQLIRSSYIEVVKESKIPDNVENDEEDGIEE